MSTCTLKNIDCREGIKTLPDDSVNLVLMDPPYFIDKMDDLWSPEKLKQGVEKAGVVGGMPVGMAFDPRQGRRLQEFMYEVSVQLMRVLVAGGLLVSFMSPRLYHRMAVAIEDAGFEIRDQVIWLHAGGQGKAFTMNHFVEKMDLTREEKDALIASMAGGKTPQLRPMFESIAVVQKPKEGTFVENWEKWRTCLIWPDFPGGQQTPVFECPKPRSRKTIDHLTIKPVPLMERLLRVFSIEGHTVLDPFMGSGTTGVACVSTRRNFIGFEKDGEHFDLAKTRVDEAQQMLGRSSSGRSMHDLGTGPASQVPGPHGPTECVGPGNFTGYTGPGNFGGYTGHRGPQSWGGVSSAQSQGIAYN